MAESIIGEIQIFGFNFAPYQWMQCAGQILPIQQNTALFSVLGTQYGGNGTSNFALPDLRSRVAIGQGQGQGLSDRIVGESGGTEGVNILITEMPMHTHALVGGGATIKVSSQAGTQPAAAAGTNTLGAFQDPSFASTNNAYNNATPDITLNCGTPLSGTIGITGGSQPFGIMQPTQGLNFCINIYGVFPTRN